MGTRSKWGRAFLGRRAAARQLEQLRAERDAFAAELDAAAIERGERELELRCAPFLLGAAAGVIATALGVLVFQVTN